MRKSSRIAILLAVSLAGCIEAVVEDLAPVHSYLDLTVLDSGASSSAYDVRLMLHRGGSCGDSISATAFRNRTTASDGRFAGLVEFPPAYGQACVTLRVNGGATYRGTTVAGFRVELSRMKTDTIRTTIRMTAR